MLTSCLTCFRASDPACAATIDWRWPLGGSEAVAPRATPFIIEETSLCQAGLAILLTMVGIGGPPGFAASLAQAMACPELASARIALVDLSTIGFDFEGLNRLVRATEAPVIVIEERPHPLMAKRAREAGARGYLCASFELEHAQAVLRTVLDGAEHFPAEVRDGRRAAPPFSVAGLSPRRIEVLDCIRQGMSNQQIGAVLGITPGTAKLHTHAILRITGARNRTELALFAERVLKPGTAR